MEYNQILHHAFQYGYIRIFLSRNCICFVLFFFYDSILLPNNKLPQITEDSYNINKASCVVVKCILS